MSKQLVAKNKVISITYRISHENGDIAEQSDVPIDYIHGVDNPMFEKVESALDGKTIGDSIDVLLSPEEGFGEHDPSLTFTDDIDNVLLEYRHVGAAPSFENEHGEVVNMVVSKIENGKLTVDANHPFAGKNMRFNVTVVAIRDATSSEIQENKPAIPLNDTLQ